MRSLASLLAGAALGLGIVVHAASGPVDGPPPLTSFPQYWQATNHNVAPQTYPVRMEGVVLYHDSLWKSLWLSCGDTIGYVGLADIRPTAPLGQHVLVEGTISPASAPLIENVRLTQLEPVAPPTPIDARGRLGQAETLHAKFVTIEGLVDRQTEKDPAHLTLDLVAEGRFITVWLPHPAEVAAPQLENAVIRATGVFCATANPAGQFTRLELCVPSPDQIETIGSLDRDERFNAPPATIQEVANAPDDKLVHVIGIARAAQPGRSVTLRDDTGQITVLTAQTRAIQLGETVEAIGYPRTAGPEWQLDRGLVRRSQQLAPTLRGLPQLRLAAQLRELVAADADRGYPVHLAGVVTWAHPGAPFFFVLDGTGGAYVEKPLGQTLAPTVGDKIEIIGVSASGAFAPIVRAIGIHRSGTLALPDARPVTLEQAFTGVEDAQWVSMVGFVRDSSVEGPWAHLELGTPAGTFSCLLPKDVSLTGLRGAVVRLRGVCSALANEKRQLSRICLWVPNASCLVVEDPAPADPFAVPEHSIASLRQFGSLLTFTRRVRIIGTVVGQFPGRLLHLQDGADGLLVLSRDSAPLAPGDRVEVVGFPSRDSIRVMLHEAVYRKVDTGAEPRPLPLAGLRPVDAEIDGRLVEVEARLLEISPQERGTRLTVQNPSGLFEASLARPLVEIQDAWEPGSTLSLRGVYEVQLDEYKRPSAARLLLRSTADVQVREHAAWWTVRRALAASAVLACCIVLGFAWIVALRRRVHRQTALIREQFEKEKAARAEATLVRTSKLESLGVLAGGIAHDFNNLLNVVICNLSLLRLGQKFDPDTEQCLTDSTQASLRARDLTLQLLTFAKGGEPVRTAVPLSEVVRESGEFARHGSKVRCVYDFADDLWPAQVDKAQIGQVVHNLVLNATQAMPNGGVVIIALRNTDVAARTVADLKAGRYLQLTIADQGSGIPAELLPRIFDPYFTTKQTGNGLGLATVFSIVRKHQGQIEVASALGKGTTFTLWLPAADPTTSSGPKPSATTPLHLAGRILFMDDEVTIRRTAQLLFKRLDLEVVTVEDGAAAIREYSAALAAGNPFNAVFLDLTVPGGVGGAEAVARLLEVDPQVCAIVTSGYASDPVLARYREHGFKAVIRKPYEVLEVAQALTPLLPRR